MILKYNEFIKESLRDNMTPKSTGTLINNIKNKNKELIEKKDDKGSFKKWGQNYSKIKTILLLKTFSNSLKKSINTKIYSKNILNDNRLYICKWDAKNIQVVLFLNRWDNFVIEISDRRKNSVLSIGDRILNGSSNNFELIEVEFKLFDSVIDFLNTCNLNTEDIFKN